MGVLQKMAAERAARQANAAGGIKPKYKVLQVDMLKSQDREKASTITSFVQSAQDAYKLAGHDGFAYRDLDLRCRVGVVTYKGVEVTLLFKREIVEQEPGPADPVPEKILNDPQGAWLQIDLMNADPVEKRKGLGERLSSALQQISRLQLLWQGEEGRRKRAEEELEKVQRTKEELRGLKEKVALLEKVNEAVTKEVDDLKRAVSAQKEARRTEKNDIVRQMFPVFNTVWLAGIHRHTDQLYGMIKKQVTDSLKGIGVSFVEPAVGDQFDPSFHHAVHAIGFPEGARELDKVLQVHRVGWSLNGVVVEAADVAVGVEKSEHEETKNVTGTDAVGSDIKEVPGGKTALG